MTSSDDKQPAPSRFVEQRFAHALLEHGLGHATELDAKRTEKSLDQLWSTQAQEPGSRRFTWKGILSSAAFLLVTAALFLFNPATPNAQATLEDALRVAQEGVDRIYSLSAERWDQATPAFQAKLYLHGSQSFALHVEKGHRPDLWLGFDGEESWVLPATKLLPVLVKTRPTRLLDWFRERDVSVPLLSLSATLEKLRNYDLKVEVDEGLLLLRGHKREHCVGPTSIIVTIEEDSGVVQSLEASWNSKSTGGYAEELVPYRYARLRLEPYKELDPGFFGHAMHHRSDRLIRTF